MTDKSRLLGGGGATPLKLDSQNRLTISKFRSELTSELSVVIEATGRYLSIYSRQVWGDKVMRRLAEVDPEDYEDEARYLSVISDPVTYDGQGRITLSADQLKVLRPADGWEEGPDGTVERKVVVIGLIDRVEVWPVDRYAAWLADQDKLAARAQAAVDERRRRRLADPPMTTTEDRSDRS